ncbi:MAG: hypothetical protein ACM3JH_03815 [Acidithiobacillales bacterium]
MAALRRTLALAAIFAVMVVFTLESIPHRHSRGLDGSKCPICQAARQHVGDAPRPAGILFRRPEAQRPPAAEPAVERIASAQAVSSASPRSPPPLFA